MLSMLRKNGAELGVIAPAGDLELAGERTRVMLQKFTARLSLQNPAIREGRLEIPALLENPLLHRAPLVRGARALVVDDAEAAYRETTRRGAQGVLEPAALRDHDGEVRLSSIAAWTSGAAPVAGSARRATMSFKSIKAARDVIAAYLNASCGLLGFGMAPADVADLWNDAVAGTRTFESVHDLLGPLNDVGICPLGGRRATPFAGASEEQGGIATGATFAPAIDLYRPTPNPFRDDMRLGYAVTSAAGERVEIGVYDIAGRQIRSLVSGITGLGRHETRWDGYSNAGVRVTNGMYFIHISIGQERRTVHVVYLR